MMKWRSISFTSKKLRMSAELMQLSIFAIAIPPRTPKDLPRKFVPTLVLLHPNFCLGVGTLFGLGPEGLAFICQRFLEFSLLSQELATDNTLGFDICFPEILYVF